MATGIDLFRLFRARLHSPSACLSMVSFYTASFQNKTHTLFMFLGWTAQYKVHWLVPIIGTAFIGVATTGSFVSS